MGYGAKVKAAFAKFWASPALLSVLLLEFIITVLMGFLFFFIDMLVLAYLSRDALAGLPVFDWHALLSPTTIVVGCLLLFIQGLVFVYVDSFFKAGFYGMLKNAIHDGSTVFAEFMPSAKRYWYAMFRFSLLRFAIFLVLTIPFVASFTLYLWTTPQLVTPALKTLVLVTFLFGVILGLLLFYWFIWSEAIIVFNDVGAMEAVKRSFRLANKNKKLAFLSLITFVWVVILAVVLSSFISLPFEIAADRMPPEPGFAVGQMTPEWQVINGVVDFLLNVLTISATVIGSLFIFEAYFDTTARGAKKQEAVAQVEKKTKKRS